MTSRILILALIGCLASTAGASYAPRELILKLSSAPQRTLDETITSTGIPLLDAAMAEQTATIQTPLAGLTRTFPQFSSTLLIRWRDTVNLDSLEAVLRNEPGVVWVSRNHLYGTNALDDIPNDSLINEQYWINLISLPQAWEITRGSRDVIIGIIDTGIDYLHRDLAANIWHNPGEIDSNGIDDDNNGFVDDVRGWDFVDAPTFSSAGDNVLRDNDPMDEFGHGTYVAGVAAAVANNGTCVAGIANQCRIMCLRAGNAEGLLEEDDIAAAILYAAANHASVLNMSFGDVVVSPLIREAVAAAADAGVVQVGSAGNNSSESIHYPSGFAEVISVGATDRLDRRAPFSNYGPSVDLFAPGFDIVSTMIGGDCGTWIYPHGTSYACPMVAAAAALCLSVNPNLAPATVKDIMRSTADDIRSEGWDPQTAHGRLNVRRAVEQAQFGSDVVARIINPPADLGLTHDISVTGDAWGAAFERYELSYGLGENPDSWTQVADESNRKYAAILGNISLPARDTVMVIRLQAFGTGGQTVLDHRHVYIQRAEPRIDSMKVRRMLSADSYGDMVQVWSNQVTTGTFLLNRIGQDDPLRHDFSYVSDEHVGLLLQTEHPGRWNTIVQLTNQANATVQSDPFAFEITEQPFNSNLWSRTITNALRGYIGPFSSDYDQDGLPEFWLWPIGPQNVTNDPLAPYEWNGSEFVNTGNSYGGHIPQATGDADNDGLREIMARNGQITRIWEPQHTAEFPNGVVFEALQNTIGAGFYDLDPNDPGDEIIFRKNTSRDSTALARFVLFNVSSSYALSPFDTIPNVTEGDNGLGQPLIKFGDLDHDGQIDALYGDYDGDIIFCEQENGKFRHKWSMRLPLDDATAWFATGQFDNDSLREFVAGCRSNSTGGSESQRRALHWEFFVFKNTGNDQFVVVDSIFVLGNDNISLFPASVTAADLDADHRDEIILSVHPDLYVVKHDAAVNRYRPVWYYDGAASNVVWAADWDQNGVNEFFFADDEHILRAEAAAAAGNRPSPPAALTAEPLGPTSVRLNWTTVAGADAYSIYASTQLPEFHLVTTVTDSIAILTDLATNEAVTYAVTTVDAAFPQEESAFSPFVTAIANAAPTVRDTAEFVLPHFVTVHFSEPMGPSAFQQWNYRLDSLIYPEVVLSADGDKTVFLSFMDEALTQGEHAIVIGDIRDAQNSLLPISERLVRVRVDHEFADAPRLLSHQLVGGGPVVSEIEIVFTHPMSASVLDPANYHMTDPYRVTATAQATEDRRRLRLILDSRYPVGALGKTARLQIRNVFSEAGVPIDTLAADILIGNPATTLADAYVYPNPYAGRGAGDDHSVMFAGLPSEATIRIFDLRGVLVREIAHKNSLGGSAWDLTNDRQERVSAGVYLYMIDAAGESVRGKLAILR